MENIHTNRNKVIKTLFLCGGRASVSQISELTGLTRQQIYTQASYLHSKGILKKRSNEVYMDSKNRPRRRCFLTLTSNKAVESAKNYLIKIGYLETDGNTV